MWSNEGVTFTHSDAAAGPPPVLEAFLEDSRQRAAKICPSFEGLWAEITRLSSGGKRLRPTLVAMAARPYGADVPPVAVETVGAAFELLHSALIIHDDVIDRDTRRRHEPTLHGAAQQRVTARGVGADRAEHYGYSVGIIAGDLALMGAQRLVRSAGLQSMVSERVMELLDQAVFASAAGELMDIDHALPDFLPSSDAVVQATRLKTSVYSFEAPLQAGALVAGAPEDHIQALGDIGMHLGLAFQLADDLLGVFGNDEYTGKSIDNDLREGKHTLLIAEAMARDDNHRVRSLMAQPCLSQEDTQILRSFLTESGARQAVETRAREAAAHARKIAEDAQLPAPLIQDVHAVARDAVERMR